MNLQNCQSHIQQQIKQIYNATKKKKLGGKPNDSKLNAAVNQYKKLQLVRDQNGDLKGKDLNGKYGAIAFVGTFAQYLNFNPNDTNIKNIASICIQWIAQQIKTKKLGTDFAGYQFRKFAQKSLFCGQFLSQQIKQNLLYIFQKNSNNFNVFWQSKYDKQIHQKVGVINTDFIYNNIDNMIALTKCFNTIQQQYRYLKTFQRFITRFLQTYTPGTSDGLKPDGCGFHHWANYQAYMYCYNPIVSVLDCLGVSKFQISKQAYYKFRDAIVHKIWVTTSSDLLPWSMTGRTGDWDTIKFGKSHLRQLAIVGGKILFKQQKPDPVLASLYIQKYGNIKQFQNVKPNNDCGFYQLNYACAGVFCNMQYIVIAKGMTNHIWGSQIYQKQNRFGRYQGYGSVTVAKKGTKSYNGFDNNRWDWNYHPGATTKVLPWEKLIAPFNRIDQRNTNNFCGSLAFQYQQFDYLKGYIGKCGMFAMDFQQLPGNGFSGKVFADSRDKSFKFKKSVFFFQQQIICIGTNIQNNDINNQTVTTLFQNSSSPKNFTFNDQQCKQGQQKLIQIKQPSYFVDNMNVGFLIIPNNKGTKIGYYYKNRKTPPPNALKPDILKQSTGNLGYISHGKNPKNQTFQYVIIPETNKQKMSKYSQQYKNQNKRYQKLLINQKIHLIHHFETNIIAMSIFGQINNIPAHIPVQYSSGYCLIMYKFISHYQMLISICNPDIGLKSSRDQKKIQPKKLKIKLRKKWKLLKQNKSIQSINYQGNLTVLNLLTLQGASIQILMSM